MAFLDKFLSKDEQKKLAELSRKTKGELAKIPIISAVGDAIQGVSGLSDIQNKVKDNPNTPIYWLYYSNIVPGTNTILTIHYNFIFMQNASLKITRKAFFYTLNYLCAWYY